MWIKRKTYETLVTFRANVESNQALVTRLEREVTYWRERFEAEQCRADRVVDAHFAVGGIAPVSNVGIAEGKATASEMKQVADKMIGDMVEIGSDGDAEWSEELTIDPSVMMALANR